MPELNTAQRRLSPPPGYGGVAGKQILLAEDNYFIASDMARAFEAMGAGLVGPFATVEDALDGLDQGPVDGAVLDIDLRGQLAFAIADRLMAAEVPFLFATGYDDNTIPSRFRTIVRCEKPLDPARVAATLFG